MSIKSHWQKIDWSGIETDFQKLGRITWGFTSHRIILNWRQNGPIEFSFDGREVHGEIGDPASGYLGTLEFSEFRTNQIWFRGGALLVTTEVELYVTPRTER